MFKKFIQSAIFVFFMVTLCFANNTIENQIGPFNFAGEPMTVSQLISDFGQGYVHIYRVGDRILDEEHIYYVSDQKLWVEISISHVLPREVDSIIVTKKKLCEERFKPKKSFGPLNTSKGIKIGDSIDKVLNAYGNPTISIDIAKDKPFSSLVEELKLKSGKVLRYLPNQPDELLFAEFYFNAEGLHSLLISASE
jgi:hypothetical protein